MSSAARWAQMHELRGSPELSLAQAVQRLSPCDLVLVEGFKAAAIPKLEVYRASVGKPLLHPGDPHIVAIATDAALATSLPCFDIRRCRRDRGLYRRLPAASSGSLELEAPAGVEPAARVAGRERKGAVVRLAGLQHRRAIVGPAALH